MSERRVAPTCAFVLLVALISLTVGVRVPSAAAVAVPPGFQDSVVASSLSQPAVLAFAPDGRLFVGEKASGKIRVVENGTLLATPFLDLTQLVPAGTQLDSFSERGLLGIAFDPAFANNGFVYLYHTLCKQPSNGGCVSGASKNRVIRVHAVGNVTDGAAPVPIIDNIDSDAGNHNAGWIDFSPVDHALYIATGDGGSDHTKSQDLTSLSGKILRLEADGSVPADNPYFGSQAARGEIWAAGLRNPWRCRFRDDGRLLCGDVGQDTWEEINVIFEANNYGWPTTEGPFTLAQFPTFTPPIYSYGHNGSDAAIMAGDFGNKTNFPGDYADSYFFGDYAQGFIRSVVLDAGGTAIVSPPADFATGIGNNTLTEICAGPDGALYYTRIAHGDVHRILLITGNHSPIAVASPTSASGPPPLMVAFDGTASSDPDGDPLTFTWDFGDGTAPGTGPTPPAHQYVQRGLYTVTLTVSDGMPGPGPSVATAMVAVGNPPAVTITQPVDGSSFDAGMMVPLAGSATDVEDGTIAADTLTWKIVFHHSDHTHPFIDALPSAPNTFTTANSGETSADVGYEIILRATDSDGMTGSSSAMLVPNTVHMSFETVPPGLETTLDGEPHVTPFEVTSVVGMQRTIGASDAPGLAFASWSDGGASTHVVTAPAGATTYVATFATPAPSGTTATPTGAPTPTGTGGATQTLTPATAGATASATPTSTFTESASPTPIPTSTAPSTPVATSTPIGLVDSAAARDIDACQRTIAQTTLALARITLAALTRCTSSVQLCVQSSPDDVACMPKAQAACLKATGSIATATAKMATSMRRRCTNIANVMSALGVGFADLAADCTAHGNPVDDIGDLASCLAKRNRCMTENLFQLEVPRAWELLRLADIGLPAGSCLTDHGGSGAGVAPTEAKALVTCTATLSKAATAFLSARAGALGDCATALFTCVERKPAPADLTKCLAKADTTCARATDPSADDTKLRATIEARCNALPFATLRAAPGANLDGVAGECAAQGVADLASLALFEGCLAHQHECLAGELVRAAVPRTPGLLAIVGRALASDDCPPTGGTTALQ